MVWYVYIETHGSWTYLSSAVLASCTRFLVQSPWAMRGCCCVLLLPACAGACCVLVLALAIENKTMRPKEHKSAWGVDPRESEAKKNQSAWGCSFATYVHRVT